MPVLYSLPDFLSGVVTREQYVRWLHRKAQAHVIRDRKRVTWPVTVSAYKTAIHAAVVASGGLDHYTGEPLNWAQISTYDNAASKAGRSAYKAGFALLPSVDHVSGDGDGYDFVICGWRTNDSKHDMSLADFVALCRRVVARHGHLSPA
jgi:hypothetical protein